MPLDGVLSRFLNVNRNPVVHQCIFTDLMSLIPIFAPADFINFSQYIIRLLRGIIKFLAFEIVLRDSPCKCDWLPALFSLYEECCKIFCFIHEMSHCLISQHYIT